MKLILLILLVIVGCNEKATEISSSGNTLPPNHPTVPTSSTLNLATSYSSRSFDQMIKIYSKATGIHSSRAAIRNEIAKVRAQLPLNNDPTSYSAFNQIALTAVSIQFCQSLIEDNLNPAQTVLFGIPSSDTAWADKTSNELINRMALTTVAEDPFLAKIKTEMMIVMNNSSTNPVIHPGNWNFWRGSIMGCSVLLASSYFTFD